MAVSQGISKISVFAKQTALGTPNLTASAGQILRRVSSVSQLDRNTYANTEINPDQQDRGISYGLKKPTNKFQGLLSAGTYSVWMGSLLRQTFAAGISVAAVSITVAGAGPTYTLTRAAGSYLTDGLKVGDILRLSVGTFNAANINKNLVVSALTATVATVYPLNNSAMVAEGPIAGSTYSVYGKKTLAPITGQTNDYYTFEEWYSDIAKSDLFTDMKINKMDIKLPGTGNCTADFELVGLGRTLSTTQQMTTPTSVTTTPVLTAVNGDLIINGTEFLAATSMTLTVDTGIALAEGVVGSNTAVDLVRGLIKVSGSITGLFTDQTIQTLYQTETPINITFIASADQTATSTFICFNIGRLKFTGDAPDDGQKMIARTYNFTAEYNLNGGAGTAYDATILAIQDSNA